MNDLPSPFKSLEGETAFMAAYDDLMKSWPVPYDEFDIRGEFSCTHVVASGP